LKFIIAFDNRTIDGCPGRQEMAQQRNPHWGSSLDSFLKEAGIQKEVDAEAKRRVRRLLEKDNGRRRATAAISPDQKVGPKLKSVRASSQRKVP
jgi:hypothetical protein